MKNVREPSLSLPASADQWRDCLLSGVFPILDATQSALRRGAGGQGISASQLADIARLDPSLRLQLLSFINRQISQYDSPGLESGVRSVDHGATLVGLDQTLKFARSLPVASAMADTHRTVGYSQSLARAFVGGELALEWLKVAGRDYGEGSRLAAQSFLFLDALIWVCVYSPIETLSSLLDVKWAKRPPFERKSIGVAFDDLTELFSKAWSLPSIAPRNAVFLRAARDVGRSAAMFVRLSEVGDGPKNLAKELRIISKHLDIEPDRLKRVAHRCIARTAREFSTPVSVRVARNLMFTDGQCPLPDWYVEPQPESESEVRLDTRAVPTNTKKVTQIPRAQDQVTSCAQILNAYLAKKIPVHTAMQQLVASAKPELSCKRVILCMMNRDRTRLVGRFSSEPEEDVRATFDVVVEPGSLISKLLVTQAGLMVSETNRAKVTTQLPAACWSTFDDRAFSLMSIFARSKAIGLMIAEFHEPTPQERQYHSFKQLCVSTSQAIESGLAA